MFQEVRNFEISKERRNISFTYRVVVKKFFLEDFYQVL